MAKQDSKQQTPNSKKLTPQNNKNNNNNNNNSSENNSMNNNNNTILSPRFKSVAEMAGWDEEALLLASLVVEDTPDRLKSPLNTTSSTRKRRRIRPSSIPITLLNLDDTDPPQTLLKDSEKGKNELPMKVEETIQAKEKEKEQEKSDNGTSCSALACMDRLKDELSCAICLEICYEPSTTPCGHSFCKNCLKSAADKCGKRCPKCRQLISNGRSCTINTVLWNTIQLIFPQEVEARKAAVAAAASSRITEQRKKSPETRVSSSSSSSNHATNSNNLNVSRRMRQSRRLEEASLSSRSGIPDQDEDAALALRLQREEFMDIYRGSSLARDNLRAMARRAMNVPRNRNA